MTRTQTIPTATLTLAGRAEVETALAHPNLVPPGPPPSIGAGPTAELRAAMARFSSGDVHAGRRAEVLAALDALPPPAPLRAAAAARTVRLLTGGRGRGRVDALADLGYRVPVLVLVEAFAEDGPVDDAEERADDVRAVVEVIGRGAPATPQSDEAARRLLQRFTAHPAGPVPVVSLLYQAHDATAALLAATLVNRYTSTPRRSAIDQTLRTAVADGVVAGRPVAAGTTVVLDLAASGLELGAGPHRCPGFEIAEALVAGIVDALTERGYELVPGDPGDVGDVGDRPTSLPMEPRP